MIRALRFLFLVLLAQVLQVTVFPAYFRDPFQPSLLIFFAVHLGLQERLKWGGLAVFVLGLVQDSFNGIYFGLNGFSFLFIFLLLSAVADRLYTDRRSLMVIGVFFATTLNAIINLFLLLLFSESQGIYSVLLRSVIPQGLVNALVASIIYSFTPLADIREAE